MSNRPEARQASRAEARRRARLAAQGHTDDVAVEQAEADQPPPRAGGGFLQRLVPPAPPLPDKGDPLAGFTYSGPLRGIVAGLYLLARNPLAWVAPGVIWLLAGLLPQSDSTIALIASVGQYIALIGAGWIGWQRPWLFGVAAVSLGWAALAGTILFRFATNPQVFATPSGAIPSGGDVALALGTQTLMQLLVGFVAGWYGGYLRRRLADQRPRPSATRARRR
jgi:hypothetical protein